MRNIWLCELILGTLRSVNHCLTGPQWPRTVLLDIRTFRFLNTHCTRLWKFHASPITLLKCERVQLHVSLMAHAVSHPTNWQQHQECLNIGMGTFAEYPTRKVESQTIIIKQTSQYRFSKTYIIAVRIICNLLSACPVYFLNYFTPILSARSSLLYSLST